MEIDAVIETVQAVILAALAVPGVQVILGGVFLNTALAIAAAMKSGKFNLQELGSFLMRDVAPYVVVYYAFALAGDALEAGWVTPVVFALISANLIARMIVNLKALGVPIPDGLVTIAGGASAGAGESESTVQVRGN